MSRAISSRISCGLIVSLLLILLPPSPSVLGLHGLSRPIVKGGVTVDITEAPWQVGIISQGSGTSTFCGGTLIDMFWVLTAAHCVSGRDASDLTIIAGSTSYLEPKMVVSVNGVFIHPEWQDNLFANDIALLRLSQPIVESPEVSYASFAPDPTEGTMPPLNSEVSITGWGSLSEGGPLSRMLQKASVYVLSSPTSRDCIIGRLGIDTSRQLCAGTQFGAQDSCSGDSGGGLIWWNQDRPIVEGIVSYGEGCGRPQSPGIYTRVRHYAPWIESILNGSGDANVGGNEIVQPSGAGAETPLAMTTPPSPPVAVRVVPRLNGTLRVEWEIPQNQVNLTDVVYEALTVPGGHSCLSTNVTCDLYRLKPGLRFTISVRGNNASGYGRSSPKVKAYSVNRVLQVGKTLKLPKNVQSKVDMGSRSTCHLNNGLVIGKRPGLCILGQAGSKYFVSVRKSDSSSN